MGTPATGGRDTLRISDLPAPRSKSVRRACTSSQIRIKPGLPAFSVTQRGQRGQEPLNPFFALT